VRGMPNREAVTHLISSEGGVPVRRRLELVHHDLCGQIAPATPRGNMYFLLLIDVLSRYMWLAAIPSKDRAVATIMEI
jgi:hypothetical protein